MDLPVVNHDDYFAKIGDDHKFPINKFGELANYLIQNKIVKKFHKPYPCSFETLSYAHSENYISNIKNKTLNIHMGISPYYRGTDCNFWALYDNNPHLVGATIHLLSKGLDSGAMLYHALSQIKNNCKHFIWQK